MWSVWRVNGRDPYRIFHDLDENYVPLGGGEPMPPLDFSRLQAVLYAFGEYEFKTRARLAGAKLKGDGDANKQRASRKKQERSG